jgi:prepilin signal peptidase PulO-like enzyme (type II secretory pathway)
VPAKGDTDGRTSERPAPKFRRPPVELVQRAARRLVRGSKASFTSQAAFRAALLDVIRRDEPLATIGGPRLRRLLVGVPGLRLRVKYRERPNVAPPSTCPVCGSPLGPIRNRTLSGDTIVLGQRCTRCDYWTHSARRVPVRYSFVQVGIDGRPTRRP